MTDTWDVLEGLELDLPSAEASGEGQDTQQFLGPYHLIKQVGIGGVARVWRARHIHPGYADKTFAVKILHDELSRDPNVVRLFRNEAYVLAMLKHRSVVETFEAGTQDSRLFIAMEYIDGRDLDNMIVRCHKQGLKIPLALSLHVVAEVLRALDYAHHLTDADGNPLSLVHRDVNPANVFVSFDGRVKLGDFGVASLAMGRVEKERELAGKVGYFAPEQLQGQPVDKRADLFAMGVLMFELLCGVRLFQGEDVDQLMRLNKKAKIPKPSKINPEIPADLEAVIMRALERKPENRYASAAGMLEDLAAMLPSAHGMPLAVAALMRTVFSEEYSQSLRLAQGLAGAGEDFGAGHLVYVVSNDERARAGFDSLLRSRGYAVRLFESVLQAKDPGNTESVSALMVDLASPDFQLEHCALLKNERGAQVPVVGFCAGLDINSLRLADDAGAVDVLVQPFTANRALASLRAAATGVTQVTRLEPIPAMLQSRAMVRPKALLLSRDDSLILSLAEGLVHGGYEIQVSPTVEEAIERTLHASHHVVVYDAIPGTMDGNTFAAKFRSQTGMGLVPVLFLTEFEGVVAGDADRSASRSRLDPPGRIVETLNQLRGDTRLGRTFIRYASLFAVELRYAGRVFRCETVNLSRGGVMVSCDEQMPAVGSEVSVGLAFPGPPAPVEAQGLVARVDIREDGTRVGVEFESFTGNGEALMVRYLSTLAQGTSEIPQPAPLK